MNASLRELTEIVNEIGQKVDAALGLRKKEEEEIDGVREKDEKEEVEDDEEKEDEDKDEDEDEDEDRDNEDDDDDEDGEEENGEKKKEEKGGEKYGEKKRGKGRGEKRKRKVERKMERKVEKKWRNEISRLSCPFCTHPLIRRFGIFQVRGLKLVRPLKDSMLRGCLRLLIYHLIFHLAALLLPVKAPTL